MIDFREKRHESLGFRVSLLFRTNACLLEKRLSTIGIVYGQAPYVIATNENEGQTQDELAARLRVNRAATARHLKAMEKAGLIIRQENPDNRRQKLVYPTEKSKALVEELLTILDDYNAAILTGFSQEEKDTLLSLMDRAIANTETMRCDGGDNEDS